MPEKLTVSNTSALLYLNLINRLDLLPLIYQTVAIPPAVADERLKAENRASGFSVAKL
jgi:predicted nucleic acid-binding protein